MANPIDIIITKQAQVELDSVITKLGTLDKAMQDVAQTVIDNSKKMASAVSGITPTAVNNKGAENAKLQAELDALKAKYSSLHDTIVKKAEQSRLAEIKLQQQREKAFDSFDKNAKKEQAVLEKNASLYNKTQQQINTLTKAYNDLSVKKERYGTLTANEEMRLKTLQTVTEKYNGVLKGTDANIGKYTRNVGNYASGYNALGNSINQLTREAPAFANSLNTGFMAISNNIPALTDAIKGIREQNALLRSEGQPTKSVLNQLAGAFFSWQTAISLGVTLLTLYGGTIVKWIGNLGKADSSLSSVTRAQQSLNKAQSEAEKNTSSEITHLQLLAATAEDLALPMNQRKIAVKEMQELYPHYLGNLSEEAILAGETSKQMAELAKNIMAAAVARGIEDEISKKAMSDYKARKLLIGELNTDLVKYQEYIKKFENVTNKDQREAYALNAKVQFQMARERKLAALKALEDQQNAENEILIKGYKRQVELSGKLGPDGKDEADKKTKKAKAEDPTPKIKELESSLKSVGTITAQINEEIDRLTVDRITSDESALPAINFQLDQLLKLKKQLNGVPDADVKILNAKKSKQELDELTQSMKDYLKSFETEFIQNMGFTETFKILNDEIEGFGENWQITTIAIMESAQELYSFLTQNSEANFNAEKERLQSQYDVSLKYAGDNKAAQEKLAEDLEKSKADIANREAKAKQKQAMFNIAIDTAQAILGLWANPGFPAAIPLTIAVGALGAAQIAMVASQEIPQYWMGGTHDGGLMMVNDGVGSNYKETIVTPDGKVMKPQGRNVIMDAPKGTEIYTANQWQEQLHDMLMGKGIAMSNSSQYHGITKNDMYEVMADTLGSQPQYVSNFDADGATDYIIRGGNKTIINKNRGNGRGVKV